MAQTDASQQTPPHEQQKKRQSWSEYGKEWADYGKEKAHEQYESWMPWIEDLYLRWFSKHNKASYTVKDNLDKTKITGIKQVDNLQDGVHNLVSGQVGQGGLAQPLGDTVSKEGLNRAERGGKDEKGSYAPGPAGKVINPVAEGGKTVGNATYNGGQAAVGKVGEGVGAAGGYVGGLFGGKKD